jgi:hypothetical protein
LRCTIMKVNKSRCQGGMNMNRRVFLKTILVGGGLT